MPTGKPTGIYCPLCDRQGVTNSQFLNAMGKFSCTGQGHGPYTYQQVKAMNPRLQQLNFVEKQPPGTVLAQIWVHPEAIVSLQERYPNNLMTTIDAILTALADPDTLMLEGEHTRELRDLGVHTGRDIAGLARANQELRGQIEDLRMQQRILEPILRLMGQTSTILPPNSQPNSQPNSAPFSALSSLIPVTSAQGEPTEEGGRMVNGNFVEDPVSLGGAASGSLGRAHPVPASQPHAAVAAPLLSNLISQAENRSPAQPSSSFSKPSPIHPVGENYEPGVPEILGNLGGTRSLLATPGQGGGIPQPTPGPQK